MAFQKFRGDQLFDGYRLLDDKQVLVTGEKGDIQGIIPLEEAGDDVRKFDGILSPGFINCHCHLELSHMKGLIPEKTGLVQFVFNIVKQRHFPEDEILEATEKAEDEMLVNGIVAVGDICNSTDAVLQKTKARMRYHNFIEVSGFTPAVADQRFQRALQLYNTYTGNRVDSVLDNSIVPHAAYSVTDELWQHIIHFPGNELLTIHNQETAAEDELFLNGSGEFLLLYEKMGIDISFFKPPGKSSLQSFLPKFLPDQSVVLVHNVHTSKQDLDFCFTTEQKMPALNWCLCPNANLYISGRLPDVELLTRYSSNIVLGTDSLASNHALSILSEMKTMNQHFPGLGMDQLFKWATSNGAKALKMDNQLGSFEPGKRPGVLVCNTNLTKVQRIL